MQCVFCGRDSLGLIKKSVYGEGIWVCLNCYELINKQRYHPYSWVMDKVAMLEAGYHVNRKLARIRNNRG